MYDRYHPRARRRVRELALEYADRFESTLLGNAIADSLPEDELLLQLADVVERLDDLQQRATATDDELKQPLQTATYNLTVTREQGIETDVVRKRAKTVVQETIDQLEADLDDYCDVWDEKAIDEAKREIGHIRDVGVATTVTEVSS